MGGARRAGWSVCAKRGCSATRELEWMESCVRGGRGRAGRGFTARTSLGVLHSKK